MPPKYPCRPKLPKRVVLARGLRIEERATVALLRGPIFYSRWVLR
jgi:hypothetical protein